jgi:hypothetical protein
MRARLPVAVRVAYGQEGHQCRDVRVWPWLVFPLAHHPERD